MRKILLVCCFIFLASSAFAAGLYSVDDDGDLWFNGAKGGSVKVAEDEIHHIDETSLEWINTDEGILIFATEFYDDEDDVFMLYVKLNKKEECLDVKSAEVGFVLELSSNNIAMIDDDGKIRFRTPGTGPLLIMDEYRYAFNSVEPGKRRGQGKNAKLWSGVSVFEYFTDDDDNLTEFSVEPVCEPDETTNYKLLRIDYDENEIIIMKESVKSPEEWDKAKPKINKQEINVEFPAAG